MSVTARAALVTDALHRESHGKKDTIGMGDMVEFLGGPAEFGSSACACVPTLGGNSAGCLHVFLIFGSNGTSV